MRSSLALAILAALLASYRVEASDRAPDPVPVPFTVTPVTDRDLVARVLAPHTGRVLLLSAWASWCAPCLEELPGLLKLRAKLAKRGVDVVFVNADPTGTTPERLAAVLRKRSIALEHSFVLAQDDPTPFLAAIDPAWNGTVPYHAVFGRDGKRSASLVGARPLAEIELALVGALEAAPSQVPPGPPADATPGTRAAPPAP